MIGERGGIDGSEGLWTWKPQVQSPILQNSLITELGIGPHQYNQFGSPKNKKGEILE